MKAIAWTEYLKETQWSYFATFTTRYPLTLKSARRTMTKVAGKVLGKDGRMFWAAEAFPLGREGYHCHALIKSRQSPSQIDKWYSKKYGRCDIQRYDPLRGAAGYVAKYLTKKVSDYDLL